MDKNIARSVLLLSLAPAFLISPGLAPAFGQITVEASPASARDSILKGNYYLGRNMYKQAIEQYEEALKQEPGNSIAKRNLAVAHNNWGRALALQHKDEEALEQWQEAIKADASYGEARRNISVLKANQARLNAINAAAAANGASPDVPIQTWDPGQEDKPKKAKAQPGKEGSGQDKAAADKQSADKEAQLEKQAPAAVILTPGLTVHSVHSAENESKEATLEINKQANSSSNSSTNSSSSNPYESGYANTLNTAAPAVNMEEQLGAIEMKVYGHKESSLPVLKRLEKLESDTSGGAAGNSSATAGGTIKERIQKLRQSWGL